MATCRPRVLVCVSENQAFILVSTQDQSGKTGYLPPYLPAGGGARLSTASKYIWKNVGEA